MTTKMLLIYSLTMHTILGEKRDWGECNVTAVKDAYQCEGTEISTNETQYCLGYKACYDSKIGTEGDIMCLGGDACGYSKEIISDKDITCCGYSACKKVQPLQSKNGNIRCFGDEACDHANITVNGWLSCNGQKGCYSADVQASNIECLGYKSCQQTNHWRIAESAYCDGHSACSYATIETKTSLYCRAKNSCEQSAVRVANTIDAFGVKSLYYVKVATANVINAFGYQSIAMANMDSMSHSEMIVNAYGYEASGQQEHTSTHSYMATFTCRSNSHCTLNCKGNGCIAIKFLCENGSQCTITPNACMLPGHSESSVDFITCPLYYPSANKKLISDSIASLLTNAPPTVMSEYDSDYEYGFYGIVVDISDIKTCDDFRECEERRFTRDDSEVYCLGDESCVGANIDFVDDIQCYGFKSCMNAAQIVTDGTENRGSKAGVGTGRGFIKCSSTKSCYGAGSIIAADSVYCNGVLSCAYVPNIQSVEFNVHCDGVESCLDSDILARKKVTCLSIHSCKNVIVHMSAAVECNGPEACANADLTTKGKVACDGFRSCVNATINTKRYEAYSSLDSLDATITAGSVMGYGYQSLAFSTIDSGAQESMRVTFYGYLAGEGAMVLCRTNAQCKVTCEYDGCYQMTVVCYGGARCSVFPKKCRRQSTFDTVVNGTFCPMTVVGTTPEMDEFVRNAKVNKQRNGRYIRAMNLKVSHSESAYEEIGDWYGDRDVYANVDRSVHVYSDYLKSGHGFYSYSAMILSGVLILLLCVSVYYYGSWSKYQYFDGYIPV